MQRSIRRVGMLSMALLLVGMLAQSPSTHAGPGSGVPWTTIGSAGTVDETATTIVDLTGPSVQLKSSAPVPATLTIRYNITAEEAILLSGGYAIFLAARYRDNGSGARIQLKLRQVDVATGVETTMLAFDSDSFSPLGSFQTQHASTCAGFFEFRSNVYYIEATLDKTNSTGKPALSALILGTWPC